MPYQREACFPPMQRIAWLLDAWVCSSAPSQEDVLVPPFIPLVALVWIGHDWLKRGPVEDWKDSLPHFRRPGQTPSPRDQPSRRHVRLGGLVTSGFCEWSSSFLACHADGRKGAEEWDGRNADRNQLGSQDR